MCPPFQNTPDMHDDGLLVLDRKTFDNNVKFKSKSCGTKLNRL